MQAYEKRMTLNQAINILLKRKSFEKIPPPEMRKWLLILRAMASHINSQTRLCNPSQQTLAIECLFESRKTVQRHINKMKLSGIIEWVHVDRPGGNGVGNVKRRPNNSYSFKRLFEMADNAESSYKFEYRKS